MAVSVLIVDDHPGFRQSARILLEGEGYRVVGEAGNGIAAVEAVRSLHPDVVLLDVQLPDCDGFQVAGCLHERGCAAAVIMTSSRDACDFGQLAERNGALGFIPKAELSGAAVEALLS